MRNGPSRFGLLAFVGTADEGARMRIRDLMEEFRPLVVDSAVLTAVNTGMLDARDFMRSASECALKDGGRKAFIRADEARPDQLVTHPLFGYRPSGRPVIRVQARLLSRWLRRDVPEYIGVTTR